MTDSGSGISDLAQRLLAYAHAGNWRMLFALALVGVTWVVRNSILGPPAEKFPVVGAVARWLRTDRGGVVLTLTLGVLGGLVTALSASAPLGVDLLVTGLVNGLLASGFFVAVKKILGLSSQNPPDSAAALAKSAVPMARRLPSFLIGAFALVAAIGMSGCACFKPENINSKACVIAQHEIDCAKDDIRAMLPKFIPLVTWLFAGAPGPLDTSNLVSALEQIGFRFVGCTAVQLEHDLTVDTAATEARVLADMPEPMKAALRKQAASQSIATSYHEGFAAWRARHSDVKFCFTADDGGKVCR